MRKFLGLENESWPDWEHTGQVSVEDAQVMEDEAIEQGQELVGEVAEANRMLDVADSLEDMAVVTEPIVEATPAEAHLVQIAGDMAVAGSDDVTAEDVVPATESSIGRRIAHESFTAKAKEIWERIKQWLKDVWKKVEKFFYNIFGTIPRARKTLEGLEKRLEKVEDDGLQPSKDGKNLEISSGIQGMMVSQKPVKSGSELKAALGVTKKAVEYCFNKKTFTDISTALEEGFDNFDLSDEASAKSSLVAISKKVINNLGSSGLSSISGHRWEDEKVFGIQGVLGGRDLVKHYPNTIDNKSGVLAGAEKLRRARVEFTTFSKKVKVPDEVKFATLSTGEIRDIIDACYELLNVMEKFHRGSDRKDILKGKDDLIKASERFAKNWEKEVDDDEDGAKARTIRPYANAMIKYNTFYTTLCVTATQQAFSVTRQAVNTAIMLVSRSLSQYKKAD